MKEKLGIILKAYELLEKGLINPRIINEAYENIPTEFKIDYPVSQQVKIQNIRRYIISNYHDIMAIMNEKPDINTDINKKQKLKPLNQ
jgi:hypothetical protein